MKTTMLLLLLTLSMTMSAQKRSEAEMKAIATQHLQGLQAKGRTIQQTITVKSLYQADQLGIYGDEGSFVVVSRSVMAPPVLGYSTTTFDANNMPDGFIWWLNNINTSLASHRALPADWTREVKPVAPFITTQWGQGSPYNMSCPKITVDGSTVTAPTGCVATAAAQILRYFEYPAQGRGKGYYSKTVGSDDVGSPISATISSKYSYKNMLDNYSEDAGNIANQRSVAALMRDCGYAAGMHYTPYSSGAVSYEAARGLAYNMAYDSLALHYYIQEYFTANEWRNMVYDELEAKRPIFYSAADYVSGGHAFLFDGIDADGLVHVNWGWEGLADGFYDMFDLSTESQGGPNDSYNERPSMIVGFRPDETPTDDEGYETFFCSSEKYTFEVDGENLIMNLKDAFNCGYLDVQMFIAICFFGVDDEDAFDGIQLSSSDNVPTGYGFTINQAIKLNLNTDNDNEGINLAPGTYDVVIASVQDSERGLVCPIRSSGIGALIYQITKNADGSLTMGEVTNFETGINQIYFKDTKNGFVPNANKGIPVGSDIYDITGRKITEPAQGQIYIERYRYSDGSTYSVKRIAK